MTEQQLPEGVSWHPHTRCWRADYRDQYIGSRFSISEAASLYREHVANITPDTTETHEQHH